MQINRLDKDELEYELTVRGIALGNCEEMRRRLSSAFQMERDGDSLKYPKYPYTFVQDMEAIQKKLEDMEPMVNRFNNSRTSGEAQKLQTKFSHVFGRLDNMDADGDEDLHKKKSDLVGLVLTLRESFNAKMEEFEKKTIQIVPARLNLLESQIGAQTFQEGLQNASRSSALDDVIQSRTGVNIGACSKMIPPHKWDLQKFSGDMRGMSINAFFERVEELRLARNVSKETLLDAGIDLFIDKAYQFYKDCRSRVCNWDELVEEFRAEYLSANHNDTLFEELQKRTQHPSETIGVYLAVMSGYFNRLGCPISEGAKLSIVLGNLHPFYQDRLRDPLPTTMSELRSICRRMEARRDVMNKYVEPSSRRGHVLEKDLAFIEVTEDISSLNVTPTSIGSNKKEIVCFRCKKPGHKAIGCAMPGGKYCFKCNREGYTVRNCPNCAKQGNGPKRT
ncbi:hypothetical protein NQ314_016160 [Rhamnusium bicolor]|uniref:CCHC-type domain-containing protein n=1 Tax=Rhamnusium bicolor TaxID=1586634 RepID=A0AAV8WXL9_9CUCU|nr:hypothetical protein NQ314_016160 [Rhamnusium bicolor]